MIKTARIKFDKLKGETPKAFLIQLNREEYWIPKSQCRSFTTNNKLGGHVELPAFIINRMFNIDINEMEELPDNIIPTYIVEHHIPLSVIPLKDNTIKDLAR